MTLNVQMTLKPKTFDFRTYFLDPQLRWNYKEIVYEKSGPSCISLILTVSRLFCCFCENSLIILCQELYNGAYTSVVEFYTAGLMTD